MAEIKIYRGNSNFQEIAGVGFIPEEMIPQNIYAICQDKGYPLTWYIDPDMLAFLVWIREELGCSVTVNDWKWIRDGKVFNWRAIRIWWLYQSKAKLSQHYFLNAIDFILQNKKPLEALRLVQENFSYVNREFGITTAENLKSTTNKNGWGWNHFDKRWWGKKLTELQIV